MEKFLKVLQAGWILAMCAALIHVYFDLIPTNYWYWQIFVLIAFGVLFTLWITLVVKILKPSEVDTSHKSKVLNIPRVINCKPDIKAALNASVSAIYFADNSDYKSYHYEVIRSLTNLKEPTEQDIKMLMKELNPD